MMNNTSMAAAFQSKFEFYKYIDAFKNKVKFVCIINFDSVCMIL